MAATLNLSIFLLRHGKEATYERDVGDDRGARVPLQGLDGYFSALRSTPRPPNWLNAVNTILDATAAVSLDAQSPGGLLIIERGTRTFVITFGHAWMRLQSDWLERDFGRRVVLNLMNDDAFIEVRTEQVFAQWHLASERAPRGSSVESFGVEFDRDMVSVVEGVSSDPLFGRSIRGGTSLRVNVELASLGALLDRSLTEFASDAYQKRWPDIDNLSAVADPAMLLALEAELDKDLVSGKAAKRLVLFTPAQRRGEPLVAASYVIGRTSKNPAYTPYLTFGAWESYAKKYSTGLTVAAAKKATVHLMDEAADEVGKGSVFECFGYEVALNGNQYILSSGQWYEVVSAFLKRVNRTVTRIPPPTVTLPGWNQKDDEGTYNAGCAATVKSLLLFDKKLVGYGGGQSKFEFCDLMDVKGKRLYFVKIPSRSSGMSHLIEQTRRTVELFFSTDNGFRAKLSAQILKNEPKADISWTTSRPRAGDWNLCLVSMGKQQMALPFFARCSLANMCRDLESSGHVVEYLAV
jgi:uncharacterized protein (TIGR04141 family)